MQSRLRSAAHVRLAVFLALVAFVTVPFARTPSASRATSSATSARSRPRTPTRSPRPRKSCRDIQSPAPAAPRARSAAGRPAGRGQRPPRPGPGRLRSARASTRACTSISIDKTAEEARGSAGGTRGAARCSLYRRSDTGRDARSDRERRRFRQLRRREALPPPRVRQAAGRGATRHHGSVRSSTSSETRSRRRRSVADEARDQANAEQQRIEDLVRAASRRRLANAASTEQTVQRQVADLGRAEGDSSQKELPSGVRGDRRAVCTRSATSRRTATARFIRPVAGAPITSGFGYRTDPVTGQRRRSTRASTSAPRAARPSVPPVSGKVFVRRRNSAGTATRPSSTTAAGWRRSTATSRRSRSRPGRS